MDKLLIKEIKSLNLDELAELRKFVESQIIEKLYGLKGGLSDSVIATEFAERRSYAVIKDELPMGRYDVLTRPPEQSTLKLDLDDESRKIKQLRIFFTFNDWKKITGL